jgi:hypothetical protein
MLWPKPHGVIAMDPSRPGCENRHGRVNSFLGVIGAPR